MEKVWLVFGDEAVIAAHREHAIQEFAFPNLAELNAFLEGVSIACQSTGYEDFSQFDSLDDARAYVLHFDNME